MGSLGKAIATKKDDILDTWLDAVRQDRKIDSTFRLSDTALGNSLPKVIKALESVLNESIEALTDKVTNASLEHGTLRAEQGYNPEEIAREYALLRRIIFEFIQGEIIQEAESTQEVAGIFIKVNEVLDHAISECFRTYVEARFVEFKQIQKQLSLTNSELTNLLETSQGNFSYLAHEIKAPLTAVIGYSELIEKFQSAESEYKLGAQNINFIERVLEGARHLLKVVNDALELSKIESGNIPLKLESVELSSVLKSVVELMQPVADQKELELKTDFQNLPNTIVTDEFRLRQILTNIISNAIRYTDAGYIEVNCTQSDDAIQIEVSDTGIGIAEADLAGIFQPYSQAYNNVESSQRKGTGLGLAITAKLVRLLQGEINVESRLRDGSKFRVTLPLEVSHSVQ